ncbi:hypothetical protein ACWGA9_32180 [Streptomyces sp. NPDC054950]
MERGFTTVQCFPASAPSVYLYDKVHPGTGPLVAQTAAAGDGTWDR